MPLSDPDRRLFRRTMKGARALKQDTVHPYRKRPAPVPVQTRKDEREVIRHLLSTEFDPCEHETGEELTYQRAGVQRNVMRKLRRGEYVVEQELDLHGRTVPQARDELVQFLHTATTRGLRCVRIVHGKGLRSPGKQPVLKLRVFQWLKQRDEVLAFCSAPPVDGGTGAIYALLKRKQ